MSSQMPTDDTNRRVAEACGFEIAIGSHCILIREKGADGPWLLFEPQTLAHDAVLAAEKFGLFDPKYVTSLQRDDDVWSIFIHHENGDANKIGSGTFCQAITRAILSLTP